MSLIKSISGIRGTIGGRVGDNLTPVDVVRFVAAYATFIQSKNVQAKKIVVGRDARISGEMVNRLVVGTLLSMGFDVIDLGLATTPTTELAVLWEQAPGGIIITASHNPIHWNALKLLSSKGEFLTQEEGEEVLEIAQEMDFSFAEVKAIGKLLENGENSLKYIHKHIDSVLGLPLVNTEVIQSRDFSVIVDCVNSVGGIAIPLLLEKLGVKRIEKLNCKPDGEFAHNPEPIPQNLTEISKRMKEGGFDVGFVVDPDVDRLAILCENGEMFGEEYTLVSVADYVLQHTAGNTVSNLSSSKALRDITLKYGQHYTASAVGEVNVVEKMKEVNAIIGGEGNGGIIYPELHYGRDALVGIGLFLTNLACSKKRVSELRASYPDYFISKQKMELTPTTDVNKLLAKLEDYYRSRGEKMTNIDGIRIDFAEGWVHLRRSNTEPIIRIYSEAHTQIESESLARGMILLMNKFLNE
ncbi:MAG TPA: phosphoglucosamine mutase [Porphyromonadaceae bacterium]|nr:phosphoglucosamine mutase [Porphyromonadaceae bacterium]